MPSTGALASASAIRRWATRASCSGTGSERERPPLRARPSENPRQRWSSPALPFSWLTHSARRDARAAHPLAGLQARLVLGLADVGEHAELAELVAAGVDRDDRDAGLDRGLDRRRERLRVRERDDEPVGPVGDRLVDVAAHALDREAVGRAVGDGGAALAVRLLDPALDDLPELVGRLPVRDEDDPRRSRSGRRAPGGRAPRGSRRRHCRARSGRARCAWWCSPRSR